MRIFFLIVIFLFFVLFGVYIYKKYIYRIQIFEDMVYLTKYFKNNIAFTKDDFDVLLNSCLSNLNKITRSFLKENKGYLDKKDDLLINTYFNKLGFGDVCYEIKNLDYYETMFLDRLTFHKDNKKIGVLYLKLIISLGVLVFIIMI